MIHETYNAVSWNSGPVALRPEVAINTGMLQSIEVMQGVADWHAGVFPSPTWDADRLWGWNMAGCQTYLKALSLEGADFGEVRV